MLLLDRVDSTGDGVENDRAIKSFDRVRLVSKKVAVKGAPASGSMLNMTMRDEIRNDSEG
jgi:hypothetical protein